MAQTAAGIAPAAPELPEVKEYNIAADRQDMTKALVGSKEVDDIVNQMRALLTQNGQSTALADEALAAYKAQKSEMVSSLTSKLYG